VDRVSTPRQSGGGQITSERRACGTTYAERLALSDGLTVSHCPVGALARPGIYGRPVYHGLAGTVEVLVGKARERRPRPGIKTDPAAAPWSAAWLAHGLIRPSVVPPPRISAWRDLPRTRVARVPTRTPAKTRAPQVLEDTHVKRSSVVTALWGVRGRRMRAALNAGERDAHTLATLALGKRRHQLPPLELARAGQGTAQPARLIQGASRWSVLWPGRSRPSWLLAPPRPLHARHATRAARRRSSSPGPPPDSGARAIRDARRSAPGRWAPR
jgi:transposase